MKLLSHSEYEGRLEQLTEEKGRAETDYRRASLALEIGTGDDATVQKAKAHLEQVEGRIAGLHGAWQESQVLAAQARVDDAKGAHADLEASVEAQLEKRKKCLSAVQRHAAALARAMVEFDECAPAIRRLVSHRREMREGFMTLQHSLAIGAAAGAVLKAHGGRSIAIVPTEQSADAFVEREAKFADRIRSSIARLAPDEELPTQLAMDPVAPPAGMYDYGSASGPPSGFDAVKGNA